MGICLHHVPGSRSFRVLWLLQELGLKAELVAYSLTDGSLRQPGFVALSPAGRVPVLDWDGEAIFESTAILQILTERTGRLAPAPGTVGRAAFLSWLGYAETQANILQSLNIQHIFLRPPQARSVPLMRLDTRRLGVTLAGLDAHLTGKDWLLDEFSAADCAFGFNIGAIPRFVPLDPYPALQAWMTRCQTRPAYRAALALEGENGLYRQDFYPLPKE